MFELVVGCLDIKGIGTHEVGLFEVDQQPEEPYCTKSPMDLVHVVRLIEWIPHLYSIYMQRDPRDVVVSRHGSAPDQYWCDFDIWHRNQKRFTKIARHPRVMEVRYEELVRDPDRVQAAILKRFAFLNQRHPFSQFHEISQPSDQARAALRGLRKISSSSVSAWRRHLPRLAQQVEAHPNITSALIAAGYEADESWLEALNGVTPDPRPSVSRLHDPTAGMRLLAYVLHRVRRRVATLHDEARYVIQQRF